jgi:glycosyltransferase involved in cell wall biosynthesis
LNIVFIRSNPVDPDSRVEKEVNTLLKAGHSIRILAWDRNDKYRIKKNTLHFENGEADIYRFGIPAIYGGGIKKNLVPLFAFQLNIYRWLKTNIKSYDVIHACDFDTAFTSSKIAFKYKKKFVYDIFDYYVDAFNVPSSIKQIIAREDKKIINKADVVIICTEKRKEQLAGATPKKLAVIHNTPPNYGGNTSKKFKVNRDKVKIVYVGILDEGRLIKEIARIIKDKLDCEYHVAGFGQLADSLQEMSNKYENIFFYGKIPYIQTLELENSCDIMTAIYDPSNPNNYYAAPNKFYEALMLGKPLIMVKNTGVDNIVIENNIGVVIDYNLSSLKDGINKLIASKNEWPTWGLNMKKIYAEKYSWEEMEKKVIDLYDSLEFENNSDVDTFEDGLI